MLQVLRVAGIVGLLTASVPAPASDAPLATFSDADLLQMLETSAAPGGRCGTQLVAELTRRQMSWSDAALAVGDTLFHDTAGGRFRVAYQVDGLAAVDTTDTDRSGVPDYVELVGSAFERSWSVEVDSLGFPGPDLGDGRYFVSTIYRGSFFGQTVVNAAVPGGSYIEVRFRMDEFCASPSDPPDCATNALLATVAHEFKHAVQIGSGWSLGAVGSWIELDASWIEDVVFDDSNDYYRFLGVANSPFTAPSQSLVATPSYQDCTWQHYLGESHGSGFMLEFADRIVATQFDRKPQLAYLDVATARGLDWVELWAGYTVANYLTAERAVEAQGFEEGAGYPLSLTEPVASLPWNSGPRFLEDLAMRFHRFDATSGDVTGGLRVNFSGNAAADWTLRVVYQNPGDALVVDIPVVDGQASQRPPHRIESFESVAVVVGNPRVPAVSASSATYALTLTVEPVSTEPASVGGLKGRFRRPAGE
jgi:hypothetical protein